MQPVLVKHLVSSFCERSKKIYDAVHGFIRFNALEKLVIDSEPFQRLHGIHQLGISYLVYPGATHTRFEHSLGTMHLATQIFERIVAKGFVIEEAAYWEQIVRLAALCHDLGHLPFSHDAEKELLGKGGHEGWTRKAILSLEPIFQQVSEFFPGKEVCQDVIKMSIGEKKLIEMNHPLVFTPVERVLSQIVTGDFFGADRIDYLLRDAQCTGVSHGLFDYLQLIEMLLVSPVNGKLEMCVEENGVESCEALLLARHFMHKRVYSYPSVKIYKFHLSRFMKAFFTGERFLDELEEYLSLTDHEVLASLRRAAKHPDAIGHQDALALTSRSNRFRALVIDPGLSNEVVQSKLQELRIDPSLFAIDPPLEAVSLEAPTFFVQMRNKQIAPASQFCQIALYPKKERCLYIHPDFVEKVQPLLAGV